MTRILIDDLLRMLPWLLMGIAFSAWGALFLLLGYQWGKRRGLNEKPKAKGDEWRQEHHKRLVAEERLLSVEQVIRYYKTVIDQLAANRDEEPRLRVARG